MDKNQENQQMIKPVEKKHYWYILLSSAVVYFLINSITGKLLSSSYPVAEEIGGIAGIAFLPILATYFAGNVGGWLVFAMFSMGLIINQLG